MLNALSTFKCTTTTDRVFIKTPRLYLFNKETNTQVHKDFVDTVDLKSIFISPTANAILSKSLTVSISRALGAWTRSFHVWASASAQATLRVEIGKNEPMRKLKLQITYDCFIQVLERFPDVLEGHRRTLEDVKDELEKEFSRSVEDGQGEDWGIIHGDFWTGK